jgi:hypothetical protein
MRSNDLGLKRLSTRRSCFALTGVLIAGLALATATGVAGQGATILIGGGSHSPGSTEPHFVLTEHDAWLLAPAAMAAAPTVLDAKWSADGQYLLASRMEERVPLSLITNFTPSAPPQLKGDISLVLWDQGLSRAQEVWSKPLGRESIRQIAWLPGTDIAFVVLTWEEKTVHAERDQATGNVVPVEGTQPHQRLLRVIASTGKTEAAGEIDGKEELKVSPLHPFGVLFRTEWHYERIPQPGSTVQGLKSWWESTVRVLNADGSLGRAVSLPSNLDFNQTAWSEDGDLFYWLGSETTRVEGKPKLVNTWYAFDPRAGTVEALPAPPKTYQQPPASFPLNLKQTAPTVTEGETTQTLRALWLESQAQSEQPRALVCADGEWGPPSPSGNAALYFAQGAAWVVPLARVEKQVFLEARRKALKAVAMSNAKQIGLALLMYSQDYDETLPSPRQNVANLIEPYLKNSSILAGFSYTFPGGTLGSVSAPADTIMGSVSGPGGAAFIYVDGHVRWKDDSP